ncbi:hypothetical protein ACGFZP_21010 [Kitasatospora sp. NPDC048239]
MTALPHPALPQPCAPAPAPAAPAPDTAPDGMDSCWGVRGD